MQPTVRRARRTADTRENEPRRVPCQLSSLYRALAGGTNGLVRDYEQSAFPLEHASGL
jgi:hypothetical protein